MFQIPKWNRHGSDCGRAASSQVKKIVPYLQDVLQLVTISKVLVPFLLLFNFLSCNFGIGCISMEKVAKTLGKWAGLGITALQK